MWDRAALLAGGIGTTPAPTHASVRPSSQTSAVQLVKSYIAALNTGMRTGSFSALSSVYAPNATLTMYRALPRDTSLEQTRQARGLTAIRRTYREVAHAFAGCHWAQTRVYASASGERVVSNEKVLNAEGRTMSVSVTVATIRTGKITHLDWTLDFGVGRTMS